MAKRTRPRLITIRDCLKNPTAAAYGAMVEQMARALFDEVSYARTWRTTTESTRQFYRECIIATLRSINITRPKEDRP